MYPVLFRIGNFPINTYGVFLALAFLCAILITVKLAERDGLPRQKIYDLSLWMLLASLIGSKILMFFTEPEYRDHPLQLLSLDFLGGRRQTHARPELPSETFLDVRVVSPPAVAGASQQVFLGASSLWSWAM